VRTQALKLAFGVGYAGGLLWIASLVELRYVSNLMENIGALGVLMAFTCLGDAVKCPKCQERLEQSNVSPASLVSPGYLPEPAPGYRGMGVKGES
jgi:hypothetical protein